MTFYSYMVTKHLNEDSPAGDLAEDMVKDDGRRWANKGNGDLEKWHGIMRTYLERRNACPEALETFEECWSEYLDYIKEVDE